MNKFQPVKGMRDFVQEQAQKKQYIEELCKKTFEKYGYEPLQTPIVEDFSLLSAKGSAGEAIKEEIYYFKDKAERELGLRFDLTVPLARVVASNPALPKPYKRYCIGQVYRYDKPQAKRYREFTQADIDIIGSNSVLADFEVLQVATEIMRNLGLEFIIKINNRALLEEIALKCAIPKDKVKECFRVLDKLDKIGIEGVKQELESKGLKTKILEEIKENSIEKAKKIVEGKGIKEITELIEICKENGLKETSFDVSLARGLEYYTGNVFEISVKEGPSVGGGGRYDKLIEVYGGQSTPAVGISLGIDRLYDTLEKKLKLEQKTNLLVMPLSKNEFGYAIKLCEKLRQKNLNVEFDVMERNIRKNIEYATKKRIKFFTTIGENEVKNGIIKIKDLTKQTEKEFNIKDYEKIVEYCK
ncbi:MAG: histidine--tRNA ligase [Candidatus Diapherotrites archaeon]